MQLAKGQARASSRALKQRPHQQYAESAKYIQNTLTEIYDYAIDRYRRVGETLLYVKEDMDDLPRFHAWVEENLTNPADGTPLSFSSAKQYMLVARRTSKRLAKKYGDIYIEPTATTTMTQVLSATQPSQVRPRTRRDVPDWEPAINKESGTRLAERQQINKFKNKIIESGYKTWATKLHPDKPEGDQNKFQHLVTAKKELTTCIEKTGRRFPSRG